MHRVEEEDYDRVMAIRPPSEIYCGADYLPDYFHKLLKMSNVEMYAALVDDVFVSSLFVKLTFCLLHIVETQFILFK